MAYTLLLRWINIPGSLGRNQSTRQSACHTGQETQGPCTVFPSQNLLITFYEPSTSWTVQIQRPNPARLEQLCTHLHSLDHVPHLPHKVLLVISVSQNCLHFTDFIEKNLKFQNLRQNQGALEGKGAFLAPAYHTLLVNSTHTFPCAHVGWIKCVPLGRNLC